MTPEYEKRREYYKRRYAENREALLAQSKAYHARHPEVMKAASKRYAKKNAAALRVKRREAYPARKRQESASHRKWVLANKLARAAYMRQWRQANRAARKLYDAAYSAAHREQRAEKQNARRAREIGNGGSHTRAQWEALKAAYAERRGYCSRSERLTKDHAVPLSRGGSDDITNIVPACMACNRRKWAKTAEEFAAILALEALVR